MKLAISFTNFGPYHLARLRALADALAQDGGELLAYETAGSERRYPWLTTRRAEPFSWTTFFPGRAVESLPNRSCANAIRDALHRDRPDAVAIVGYTRPESLAALSWAKSVGVPALLLSESQRIDHPRTWWKEAIKRGRLRPIAAALVGGPRHRDYLVSLGIPASRITLGYNAVDNAGIARAADAARRDPSSRNGLPARPYFLAVSRFVPEKNLCGLVRAYTQYRATDPDESSWDLVLCGDGPDASEVESAIAHSPVASTIHRPGFLQADALARWHAHASAFVHPSQMEPWGLVVNEAAACGLPLLVSDRAGCVETLVPDPPGTTGYRFDPRDETAMVQALTQMATTPAERLAEMGHNAVETVSQWGPDRFALGMTEALTLAFNHTQRTTVAASTRPRVLRPRSARETLARA